MNANKKDLKETLGKSYINNIDYILVKPPPTKKAGGALKVDIFITPKCFKLMAMSSKTSKAKEVRLFYYELEEWVNEYKEFLVAGLQNKIKKLEANQKPPCNKTSGYIYVVRAADSETLVKLGKTTNLRKRMENYGADKGNVVVPLLKYKVTDIDGTKACIKGFSKKHQYRRKKEIYEIDVEFLDKIIKKCIKVGEDIVMIREKKYNTVSRIPKKTNDNLFLLIYRD